MESTGSSSSSSSSSSSCSNGITVAASALDLPDGDIAVLDAHKGIVRTRAGGVEYTVCKDTNFPDARTTPGHLQWVPSDRSPVNESSLVLTGCGRSSSNGSSQKFFCFGLRGIGYFLQHVSLQAPSSDSNSNSNRDSTVGSVSMEQEDRHQDRFVYARSPVTTHVRIMQELIVESELNCLSAGEVSVADLLLDPNHLRLTENRVRSDGKPEVPTRSFIVECINHRAVLGCRVVTIPLWLHNRIFHVQCLEFTDHRGALKLLELPSNFSELGTFLFPTLGGAIYKGLEVCTNSETNSPDSSYSHHVAIKSIPNYKLKGGREQMEGSEDRMQEIACMQYLEKELDGLILEERSRTDRPSSDLDPQLDSLIEGREYLVKFRDAINDGRRLHIITEYCDGLELHHHWHIMKMGPNFIPGWFKVFRKIALALAVLHWCGVAHRDISLENILLRRDGSDRPVLLDYGQAILLPRDPSSSSPDNRCRSIFPTKNTGKEFYQALETLVSIAKQVPIDAFKTDIWQLGIVLGMIISGRRQVGAQVVNFPFFKKGSVSENTHKATRFAFYQMVARAEYDAIFDHMGLSREQKETYQHVLELFKGCLTREVSARYSIWQLINYMTRHFTV